MGATMAARRRTGSPTVACHVVLTLVVHKEDSQYVSRCSELGTTSCGDTVDEAFRNIREATLLYLNAIEEAGERERVFRQKGIQVFLGPPHEAETSVRVSTADVVGFLVHEIPAAVERHGSPAAVL
jgi:predicted RNase H-like HicB family nuclease